MLVTITGLRTSNRGSAMSAKGSVLSRFAQLALAFARPAIMLLGCSAGAFAQTAGPPERLSDVELDAMFTQAGRSQATLRLLLQKFPKGADLHNHGGTYAEDYLRWAAGQNGCLQIKAKKLSPQPCVGPDSVPLRGLEERDVKLYNNAIDAMSARGFRQGVGDPTVSGHDRYFGGFQRTLGSVEDIGFILATSREQAVESHSHYAELMVGPDINGHTREFATEPWNEADMAGRLARLAPVIRAAVARGRSDLDLIQKTADDINGCHSGYPKDACEITVRHILTVKREARPEQIFGRIALGFALAEADPRIVGINILNPEDGPLALRDYSLHMRLFAFFKQRFPNVTLTMHAGELTLGLVPPRDLRFHIREAVEIAGAKRIGHGVDIAYEDGAAELLKRMAHEQIAVEINLTSNDVILGVKGSEQPLRMYLAAGVPVVLSTDSSGTLRHDLTYEYMRAFFEHGLKYTELRKISRNSLTYSFLEGASLWDGASNKMVAYCVNGIRNPSRSCSLFLKNSPKAREQLILEQRIEQFESELADMLKISIAQ
ncbi:MAG: adenosine deaminase [Pseudomonadota bacterium]